MHPSNVRSPRRIRAGLRLNISADLVAGCCPPHNDSASTSNLTDHGGGGGVGNRHDQPYNFHLSEGPHTLPTIVVLSCFVIVVIACTLIGNTLVCLAVALVRKLRNQAANYLLVSLAVADLCVGFMVMPLAFLYLILGRWPFGQFLCDVWTSADVTLCTASILNLCVISVDRYLVIVRPYQYSPKRTGKRMIVYILIVWVLAFLTSFLPPIAFWVAQDGHCQVSPNKYYQVYATMCAFYIPATIICVVNYKIFKAARRLTKNEKRATAFGGGSAAQTMVAAAAVFVAATPGVRRTDASTSNGHANSRSNSSRLSSIRNAVRSPTILSNYVRKRKSDSRSGQGDGDVEESLRLENNVVVGGATAVAVGTPMSNGGFLRFSQSWRDRLKPVRRSISKHLTEAFIARPTPSTIGRQRSSSVIRNNWQRFQSRDRSISATTTATTPSVQRRRRSEWVRASSRHIHHVRLRQSNFGYQWRQSSSFHHHHHHTRTETKAMKTLGLIMGCFVACWLPFFTVTLLKALCPSELCNIPNWLENLVLWLGYANSTLNPLLYAKYNKDFRIPFREMLCCRFSTLKSVLRMEEYMDTFGSFPSSLENITTCINNTDDHNHLDGLGSASAAAVLSPRSIEEAGVLKSLSSPAALNGQAQQPDTFL